MNRSSSSPFDLRPATTSGVPASGGPRSPLPDLRPDQPLTDATSRIPAGDRALVLGGGGSTGNAWLIGVVAGLSEAGVDVTSADLTIGTSAGSTAAFQLAGASPDELFRAVRAPAPQHAGRRPGASQMPSGPSGPSGPSDPSGSGPGRGPHRPVAAHLERIGSIIASAEDAADMRRRMGAAALDLDAASDGSWTTQWRATVASRLSDPRWPHRTVLITAVDADTGEPVVFDDHSGIDVVDAVAASCSSGRPYRIGDRRYIDGGYRRNENADLAAGYERVLVLSPFSGRSLHPVEWGMQLAAQVDELRARGSRVETIFPDPAAEHLFGANAMNLALRPAAAEAGYHQARALAGRLADFWR